MVSSLINLAISIVTYRAMPNIHDMIDINLIKHRSILLDEVLHESHLLAIDKTASAHDFLSIVYKSIDFTL